MSHLKPKTTDTSPDTYARGYRDWTLCGLLACAIAGFPDTPAGPAWLWAALLPLLAGILLRWHRRPRRRRSGRGSTPAPPLVLTLQHTARSRC